MPAPHTQVEVARIPACDLCKLAGINPPHPAAYDAATRQGPWGYLCEQHFTDHGLGLGLGRGQRLVLRTPDLHPGAKAATLTEQG